MKRHVFFLALCASFLACGGTKSPTDVPEPIPELPLSRWVADDAQDVAFLRPEELHKSPLSETMLELFPQRWRDTHFAKTGFRYEDTDMLLVVDYPQGHLQVARGVAPDTVMRTHRKRMLTVLTESASRVSGYIGAHRYQVVTPDPSTIAIGVEHQVITSKQTSDLSLLHDSLSENPLVWMKLTPLGFPIESAVGMLLARQRSLGVAARPKEGRLEIHVLLLGEFPKGAETNFTQLIGSLAESSMGRIFGIDRGLRTLKVSGASDQIRISIEVDTKEVLRGIQTTFTQELADLMEFSDSPDSSNQPKTVQEQPDHD